MAMEMAQAVQIKVIGVGGGGGNAVNRMVQSEVQGAEFIAVNTDKQSLESSVATHRIQIGERTTRGLGCGGEPNIGMKAAEESREAITDVLRGANMVFITAGMGGGTGTGAAPIIAEISKEMGILTVGVVTKPFHFEKEYRMNRALEGIERLAECVDSLIVIPNEHLKKVKPDFKLREAFAMADQVLVEGVRNISELIKVPAYINLDFADVSAVMRGAGYAHLGVGKATGADKAQEAARQAVSSPLLETTIDGANGLIINIRASDDINLEEVEAAVDMITENADPGARVIWGILLDEQMQDEIGITVIATGFAAAKSPQPPPLPPGPAPSGDGDPWSGLLNLDPIFSGRAPSRAQRGAGGPQAPAGPPQAPPGRDFAPPLSPPPSGEEAARPRAAAAPPNPGVDQDHDMVIGMLVDKFQRERGKRKSGEIE
jgi:cell division protein FtsZ